jgi:EAL domain-containing protein (putative c-di-GMP-specific phosphodiesterase class I)
VIRTATRQARAWLDAGLPMKLMAVNISSVQLNRPDFVQTVVECLQQAGLPAQHLELELTETAAFSNAETALAMLERLRDCGVRISIDDFGTGYSSLSYLKRIHIDKLKIDRSFIHDLGKNGGDETLVEAMIHMGRSLKLTVVAEGVETREQLECLRVRGCDEVQGYYFSKPLPAPDLEAWIGSRRACLLTTTEAA